MTASDTLEFITQPNSYGVYRSYKRIEPTFIPNDSEPTLNSKTLPSFVSNVTVPAPSNNSRPEVRLSTTKELLMGWLYNGTNIKSFTDLNSLVHNVLLHPDFHLEDLTGFDAAKEAKNLDGYNQNPRSALIPDDGWIETSVPISLPPPDHGSHGPESKALQYDVQGLFYRKPVEVIKAAFTEEGAAHFHLSPFEEYWTPSEDSEPERLYSEIYNSDAFLNEQAKINSQPRPDCDLEAVIAPLLLWSDSTHLATFGTASLWPVYLYLGNQTKYSRCKPTAFAAHHLAYIPEVCALLPHISIEFSDIYIDSLTMRYKISIRKSLGNQLLQKFLHICGASLCRKSGD
jgi:hypothetical protein